MKVLTARLDQNAESVMGAQLAFLSSLTEGVARNFLDEFLSLLHSGGHDILVSSSCTAPSTGDNIVRLPAISYRKLVAAARAAAQCD